MKQLFVAALAAMAVFASCAKDDANNGENNGVETKMGLTLSFPNGGTRANETADEMKVHDITVFLYGQNGAPALGNMTPLTLADFTQSGDVYTLKHEKRITTTTGVKSVYVGVNLAGSNFMTTGTPINSGTDESLMNEFYATSLNDLIAAVNKLPGDKFRMFSQEVQRPALVAETDPNWSNINFVKVNVERQVAKMTADLAAATLADWNPSLGAHTMNGYYLGQAGKDEMYRYPVRNLDGKRLTTIERYHLGYTGNYLGLNVNGTALNAAPSLTPGTDLRTSFFGIENVSLNNIRKETTVAVFWATFVPAKATIYNETLVTGSNPKVGWVEEDWDAANVSGTTATKSGGGTINVKDGSFWLIKNGSEYKFFYTQAEAANYARDFNIDGYSQPPLQGGTLYQKGHTFFYVYLGDKITGVYEFARNQYYHLTVSGFNGLGAPGTIEPGTDPDDDTPLEPGEPTPEVPDPDEPTPGNVEETTLRVQVTVLPWDVRVIEDIVLE